MKRYCFLRLLSATLTLAGLTFLFFALTQILPGGPAEQALSRYAHFQSQPLSEAARAQMEAAYGYHKPLLSRYTDWVRHALTGNLGRSFFSGEAVVDLLLPAMEVSLIIVGFSLLLSLLFAIPLGLLLALRPNRFAVFLSATLPALFYAIPPFVFASLMLALVATGWGGISLPLSGLTSDRFAALSFLGKAWDLLRHLFLPAVCLASAAVAPTIAVSARAFREELSAPHLTAARAKGIGEWRAIAIHALRNVCVPLGAHFSQYYLANFFAGTLVVEVIFNLHGIGRLAYESILRRDYPVALGVVILVGLTNVAANLFCDFMMKAIDPRVELG